MRLQAGGEGVTRDLSASGVFFSVPNGAFANGDSISFAVDFEEPAGLRKWTLACVARVVRVEHRDGVQGVAAKIEESRLESQR